MHPERPDHIFHTVRALLRYGTTPAAGYTAAARKFPDAPALIDELGTLSFRELDERTNALARALQADGIEEGDGVAIMCRNHRGWIESVLACSKLGANALFLNTAFSGPQLTDVAKREKPKAVIYDQEFAEVLKDASARRKRYVAWAEGKSRDPLLEDVIARGDTAQLAAPDQQGRAIILTSGTTGTPKGASRSMPKSIDPIASLLSVIPLKAREKTMLAAPLFHAWGFAQWALGISLGTTVVLKRKFDEEATLSLDRPARVRRARRGAGDDPAHPRARRRGAGPLRPLAREGGAGVRLRAARRALEPLDGPLRREPLQPLRLDRGRVGDDRHAARPARRAGNGGQPAARQRGEDLRRGRQARAAR